MRSMGRTLYAQRLAMNGGMGAACPTGYYELSVLGVKTGQCVPNLSTAVSAAEGAVTGSVATGVAQSAATQQAVTNAAASSLGTSIINFYKNNTILAVGLTVAVGGFLIYGLMSFTRGK